MQLVSEIAIDAELGEAILWHPVEQRLWWTDILGKALYRSRIDGSELERLPTPEPVTAFGFTAEPGRLIVSFAGGIADFWPDSGRVSWRARPDIAPAERFNDGRVDPEGRFWGGTLASETPGGASLYRYDGELTEVLEGLHIANGLCWSPDGATAYHADSPRRVIRSYDFSQGELTRPRVFAETEEGVFPDGAVTDAAGNLWSAQWGGSRVRAYSPAGEIIEELHLSVSQPSCVAFAGPDFDHLVVTSAYEHMSAQARRAEPKAGHVFVYQTPYRGRPCDFFALAA